MKPFIIDTNNTDQFLKLKVKFKDRKKVHCDKFFRLRVKEDPTLLRTTATKTVYKHLVTIRKHFKQLTRKIFRSDLPPHKRFVVRILDNPTQYFDKTAPVGLCEGRFCLKHMNKVMGQYKWIRDDVLIYLSIGQPFVYHFRDTLGLFMHELGHMYQLFWMIQNLTKFDKKVYDKTHVILDAITLCKIAKECKSKFQTEVVKTYVQNKNLSIYSLFDYYIYKR